MQQFTIHAVMLCLLAILTYTDIKYRKLPWIWLGLTGASVMIDMVLSGQYRDPARYLGILIGLSFCVLSVLSGQAIGLGDALLFTILGGFLGIYELLFLLFISFGMTAVFSTVLLLLKKGNLKSDIPFLPFLYLAFGGMFLMETLSVQM